MEVGWHLRLSREDALDFLVQPRLAPSVVDAVFIEGSWTLTWDRSGEPEGFWLAHVDRNVGRG